MKKIIKNAVLFLAGSAVVFGMLLLYSLAVFSWEEPETEGLDETEEIDCPEPTPEDETDEPTTEPETEPTTPVPTTTVPPTTIPPTTVPPTTIPPTTVPPTTIPPTTVPPTTIPPTTVPPTTVPPTTVPPTTVPRPRYIFEPEETQEPAETEEIEEEEIPLANLTLTSVSDYIDEMTPEQKALPDCIDMAILFAENEIAKYAAKEITGDELIINRNSLEEQQAQAAFMKGLVENMFLEADIEIMREMRPGASYISSGSEKLTVKLKPSAAAAKLENIIIQTPDYSICIPKRVILSDVLADDLVITTEKIISEKNGSPVLHTFAYPPPGTRIMFANQKFIAAAKNEVSYKVTLSGDLTENIKYSFDPAPGGDYEYQAVFCSDGTPIGGKYNPLTQKIDTRIRFSDTYTVRVNKKDFGDISKKSAQMQQAVKTLASKGIINGTGENTFSPDGQITRAEITAMIVRTLISRFDENADGKFTDVKKSAWYFGAVGTAKTYGIINGMSATIFAPEHQIKKEQIIAIAARTLRSEMKYKTPEETEKYLKKFKDKNELPEWGLGDFALASMADLIVLRTDGNFNPGDTMTRGEAAIVLYRLFMKIW